MTVENFKRREILGNIWHSEGEKVGGMLIWA